MQNSTFQKLLNNANFSVYPAAYIVTDNDAAISLFYSMNEAVNFRNQYFAKKEVFFSYKENAKNIEVVNDKNLINYY